MKLLSWRVRGSVAIIAEMKRFPHQALAVLGATLVGGLSFWVFFGDQAREFQRLEEKALCVLELSGGAPSAGATFTTVQTVDLFEVGVRPGGRNRERFSLSISGSAGLIGRVTTDATRFGLGRAVPPGTYEVALRQEAGNQGVLVVIAGEKPRYVTGWQIWSRAYVGLLALSTVWAFTARKSKNLRNRATSLCLFQMLLLGFVVGFLYLLFHEGGHALGEIAFGRYDFARSDFWGIHGTPHSGGKSGSPLEPWQQALISGGGPLLPTFAGWVLFLLWRSPSGRNMRMARPIVNLYFSAIVALLVFPLVAVAGCLLGLLPADGDWHGFITNVPGPPWLIQGLLWGVLFVNGILLWRVVLEGWRSWKALFLAFRDSAAFQSPGSPAEKAERVLS